jgi:beta-1,2-mannobiose phosphorylase / 1,2-beta-oligomannan phosphorylase
MIHKHGLILNKRTLNFEIEGVLNPAVIAEGDEIHMIYRAVAHGNHSTLGYCRLSDPLTIAERYDYPIIVPEYHNEKYGVEDPRIVKIDGLYYLSYCGYDGENAFGCVATSTDLKNWKKHGIIVPQFTGDELRSLLKGQQDLNIKYFQPSTGSSYVWDKNVIFFPRRINGKLYFLHRIRPGIQLASVNDISELKLQFWREYMADLSNNIVLDPKFPHELSYIGNGAPPIETEYGWLMIYHGVHDTINGYMYVACAALLDIEDPTKEIARLPFPLFVPDQPWELKGYVNFVCFPTGTVLKGDTLYIYYGAADEGIACASVSLSVLLAELLANKIK